MQRLRILLAGRRTECDLSLGARIENGGSRHNFSRSVGAPDTLKNHRPVAKRGIRKSRLSLGRSVSNPRALRDAFRVGSLILNPARTFVPRRSS